MCCAAKRHICYVKHPLAGEASCSKQDGDYGRDILAIIAVHDVIQPQVTHSCKE